MKTTYKGRFPVVQQLTVYTYGDQCAGWKFTYTDGSSNKHSLADDTTLTSPWNAVAYPLYPGVALKGLRAYEDAATAAGGASATAFEFVATTGQVIPCGTKTDGAAVRTQILDPSLNQILVTTIDGIQSKDATMPFVVTTKAFSLMPSAYQTHTGAVFGLATDISYSASAIAHIVDRTASYVTKDGYTDYS